MLEKVRTDVIVNIIRTFVTTIISFITFPWVCRYLGATQVGTYTWVATFVSYFLILAKVGIPNLAIRECVKVRDNKELLSNKVQTFFLIQLITTAISFGLMTMVAFSVKDLASNSSLVFILSLNFLVGAYSFEWVFIALEKQFYMSVRSIVVLTISAILVIVFITSPSDLLIYSLITISVTIMTTIANLFYVRKFISFKKTMPYSFKELVKPLSVLCALSLTISLYNQTDTFILGFIDQSKAEVGSYSVGVKGIDVIIGIFTSLSTVFIPRAAYCYQQEDKKYFNNINKYSTNICCFIVFPAIALMMILSKPICGLISGNYTLENESGFTSSWLVLIVLCFMMLTYSLSEIIYNQILLPMKQEKYYLLAILGGTILNIILSIVFGKYVFKGQEAVGVAIGTMITDILVLSFLFFKTWKWSKGILFNKNTLKIFAVTLLIAGIALGLSKPMYSLGLKINGESSIALLFELISIVVIDGLIYIVGLLLLKENLVSSFRRKRGN